MAFPTLGAPTPSIGAKLPEVIMFLGKLREVVNNIMRGKLNATGTVTLTASVTTTTLTDTRIGGSTVVLLQPTTANAAAALATTYFSTPTQGSVVINHASDAQVDKTFLTVLIG